MIFKSGNSFSSAFPNFKETDRATSASFENKPRAPGSIPPWPGSMIRVLTVALGKGEFSLVKERSIKEVKKENNKKMARLMSFTLFLGL
jgi:hypothetical protein